MLNIWNPTLVKPFDKSFWEGNGFFALLNKVLKYLEGFFFLTSIVSFSVFSLVYNQPSPALHNSDNEDSIFLPGFLKEEKTIKLSSNPCYCELFGW